MTTTINSTAVTVTSSSLNFDATNISGTFTDTIIFPSGHIIQSTTQQYAVRTVVANETAKIFEHSITLKRPNSKLYIDLNTWINNFSGYVDNDIAMAVGWKTGAIATTSGAYNSAVITNSMNRQEVDGLDSFWCTDTGPTGGQGGQYWAEQRSFRSVIDIGTQTAGTVIQVALWVSSDGNGDDYRIGGAYSPSLTDSGGMSAITLMEIAE